MHVCVCVCRERHCVCVGKDRIQNRWPLAIFLAFLQMADQKIEQNTFKYTKLNGQSNSWRQDKMADPFSSPTLYSVSACACGVSTHQERAQWS